MTFERSRPDEAIIENNQGDIDMLIAGGLEPSIAYDIVKGRIPPDEAVRILQRQPASMEPPSGYYHLLTDGEAAQ